MYTAGESTSVTPRKAFLVGVQVGPQPAVEVEEHLDELHQLVESCGGIVVGRAMQARRAPDPATFIGSGKAEEVARTAKEAGADVVVFDDDLSPSQVKNLGKVLELGVLDRSAVILEIFALRARSREAQTQVELARMRYTLPRLTRAWTHLSRQVGGIGVRGGAGETQLEVDRRMLRQRIRKLETELSRIDRRRQQQRRHRQIPVVALAGYTNAGKSTLFNRLTGTGTYAEDRLFATLDARLRRGAIASGQVVVFADTVGFIRKLPHHLVSSFRSTLGEITEADLVLHVIDRSHPAWRDQQKVAEAVLTELGVEASHILPVYNKIDRLPEGEHRPNTEGALWISATTGEGLRDLKATIAHRLHPPQPEATPER